MEASYLSTLKKKPMCHNQIIKKNISHSLWGCILVNNYQTSTLHVDCLMMQIKIKPNLLFENMANLEIKKNVNIQS